MSNTTVTYYAEPTAATKRPSVESDVRCDHGDKCPWPDYECDHRNPHTPHDGCERGGDCGSNPGILMWCKCLASNASLNLSGDEPE
jgi:hypothetical protein